MCAERQSTAAETRLIGPDLILAFISLVSSHGPCRESTHARLTGAAIKIRWHFKTACWVQNEKST